MDAAGWKPAPLWLDDAVGFGGGLSRVGAGVDFFQLAFGDVEVALGGAQVFVAEEFLDVAGVGSAFEHLGGEHVAERVGAECGIEPGHADVFEKFFVPAVFL